MSAILNRFVTIRKNRGDVLDQASFRSVVEMINGIIRKYNYAGFNETYQSFLAHLEDYNDPHKTTESSFLPEIIAKTYSVYVKMTATPLSEADFGTQIVPTIGFLELMRRIVLNAFMYDKIKNPDGSVPATVSVLLGRDWGHNVDPNVPVTISFGSVLANEDAFLARGWNAVSTPIPIVFNADNLTVVLPQSSILFHTSRVAPYFNTNDVSSNYPISLFGSSNDLTVSLEVKGSPTTKTTLFSMSNGTASFIIAMKPNRTVELSFGGTIIVTDAPCNDGRLIVQITRKGNISLIAFNDSIATKTDYILNFSAVQPFVSGIVGVALMNLFNTGFGLMELTVCKDVYKPDLSDTPIPMIFRLPPRGVAPVTGSASSPGSSAGFTTVPGYNLYLTLQGTWTGTVRIQRSVDNGVNWNTITAHGGGAYAVYTQNCDEPVIMVTDPSARYRLLYNLTSGTMLYRLAQ